MKLIDLYERRSEPRGTYYGLRPTPETIQAMAEFLKTHKIPNPITLDSVHCTVIYSKQFCDEAAIGGLDPHWQGSFKHYNIWPTNPKSGPPGKCLTLGFDCPEAHDRHHYLLSRGATHTFPEFKPHLTLSYDVGHEYDHSHLPGYEGPLVFHEEYSEPLNTDWVATKLRK